MRHSIRWTEQKIARRLELLEAQVYRRRVDLPPMRYRRLPDPATPPPLDDDRTGEAWQTLAPNQHWGARFTDFMLGTTFSVPADWPADSSDMGPIALYLPLGVAGDFSHPEALAYIDGQPYAACDRHHQEILLPDQWMTGTHDLALHGWTGLLGYRRGDADRGLFMESCQVVQIDQPTRDLVAATRVALGIVADSGGDNPVRDRLLSALDTAFRHLDLREPLGDAFYASVKTTYASLRQEVAKAGAPLDADIVATGHAHIDVAWLWTLDQTRRKAGRTFHTVLRLMEQFPDYHFTQSQPQLYDYVRRDYPDLYAAVKERIAEGRWEVIGGMWVEADCNLSSGESLARQFLLGRTFFREQFGADAESPVLWLPDVFGYAWNLPQLIKEAGLEYFFTIKIGWSQYNRLPYDTFWWQGLDGTKVLTHFSTTPDDSAYASTYNANASPRQTVGTWTNFQQKELGQDLLMAFGYGDGGGGPTREMLENLREMADFPGAPRVRQAPVGEFYRKLDEEWGDQLPVWNGELYLELHRGTYTTQSRNKRANRKSEFRLHDAEFLATMAALNRADYAYPQDELRRAWELVCLNQFHDIIPGSSITPVYTESLEQYAEVEELGGSAVDGALASLTRGNGAAPMPGVVVVNPTGFVCSDPVFLAGAVPDGPLQGVDGRAATVQVTEDGAWIDAGALAPYSITPLIGRDEAVESGGDSTVTAAAGESGSVLENAFVQVELDSAGDISRILDKQAGREVLPAEARANQLQAFEDRPLNWDAWDVDIFYDEKCYPAEPAMSVRVVESGPLRATLEIERRILNSSVRQRLSLHHNSPRMDIENWVDWQERHILLKVAFPVDVLSPKATYEIQWGNVERPTHRNSSWDWARFETCAQKWVDLSEGDYGVSVLNDCKYGHDIRDNVIRISLLRGPTSPDPVADLGEHRFRYSILPHAGPWTEETIAGAYIVNDPPIALAADDVSACDGASLVAVDRANVVIETVKRAEDGNGIIVRMYECRRMRGPVTVETAFPLRSAARVNLLEEEQTPLATAGNKVTYPIRPYEIVTLRLVPA